jgi:hypothetical protein
MDAQGTMRLMFDTMDAYDSDGHESTQMASNPNTSRHATTNPSRARLLMAGRLQVRQQRPPAASQG